MICSIESVSLFYKAKRNLNGGKLNQIITFNSTIVRIRWKTIGSQMRMRIQIGRRGVLPDPIITTHIRRHRLSQTSQRRLQQGFQITFPMLFRIDGGIEDRRIEIVGRMWILEDELDRGRTD